MRTSLRSLDPSHTSERRRHSSPTSDACHSLLVFSRVCFTLHHLIPIENVNQDHIRTGERSSYGAGVFIFHGFPSSSIPSLAHFIVDILPFPSDVILLSSPVLLLMTPTSCCVLPTSLVFSSSTLLLTFSSPNSEGLLRYYSCG